MVKDMSIAERYTRIRLESGLPGRFIMRYINSGYYEKVYAEIENGKIPTERINQRLVEMMHVNPKYLRDGSEPVFLDEFRKRDEDRIIRERILSIDTQIQPPEKMTVEYLLDLAGQYNIGWEYLICGDEKCRDYPIDEQLESDLNRREITRMKIWKMMGVACSWNLEDSYQEIRLNTMKACGVKGRVHLLQQAIGKTDAEFERMTGLSHQFFVRTEEEMERAKSLSLQMIAENCHVSAEWLRDGDVESCFYPCNYQMKLYLTNNPEIREKIWKELYGEKRLSWAEKFTMIRKKLNWPGTLIMEYLDIGYSRSIYSQIEHGRIIPEKYLLTSLENAFFINPDYLYQNTGPVLLNNRSARDSASEIRNRLNGQEMRMNYEEIKRTAKSTGNSIEWILCSDEAARYWPFNDAMEDELWMDEKLRKWVWLQMGYDIEYLIQSDDLDTQGKRLRSMMAAEGISRSKFIRITGLSDVTVDGLLHDQQKLSKLVARKISAVTHYGVEWLETGNKERMRYPVDFELKQYLRNHPEIRQRIAEKDIVENDAS